MFKLLCILAVIAVVCAMPSATGGIQHIPAGVVEEKTTASHMLPNAEDTPMEVTNTEDAPLVEGEMDAQEDMEKAETFGYGYRRVIHVYPRYYYGGYYPRYHYGHYGYYW